ncbi:translocation and assembly module TamB [Agrobacterium vitis]|nr:translocation and assembly module TamB [Agrobacterium vitis]MBE1439906.1 translocation and assembly module TamB [Agrobacterium vitis]
MSQFRNLLASFGRYCVYGLCIIAGLLAIAVTVVGTTQFGTRLVSDLVASLVSKPNRIVAIDGLSGVLSGHLRVDDIRISDANGAYASLENLAIDWSPFSLLSKHFKASQIKADSITLTRTPLPATADTQDSSPSQSGFSLPLAITVDHVSLPDIRLGAAVLGTEQTYALQGNVAADQNTIDTDINLNRANQPDSTLSAKLAYAPNDNRLNINALLREPKGGVLVDLLQLPDRPALDMTLIGGGPLNDWKGQLQAALDGVPRLEVDTTHTTNADGQAVTVTGSGAFDTLLPPNLRPLFAGITRIDIATRLASNGAITVERGTIDTDRLSFTARGTYDAKGSNTLSASLKAKQDTMPFQWPLAQGNLSAQISSMALSLTGAAEAAALNATANAQSLSIPQGKFGDIAIAATSKAFNLSNLSGTIDTLLRVKQAQWSDENLARAVQAPLTITAPIAISQQQIAASPVTLESPGIGGTIDAHYARQTQMADASFTLFAAPASLPEPWAGKLKGMVKLSGNTSYSQADGVSVPNISLASSLLDATGKISFAQQQLTSSISGTVHDLAALQPNIIGKAMFDLDANGPLNALRANANVTIANAKMAGRSLTDFSLQTQAELANGAPSASLTAKGKLDGQPLNANLKLISKDGITTLPNLTLTAGTNHLKGALALSKAFLPTGKLDVTFPDLGLLAALAGQTASGDLQGTIDLEDTNGKIRAKIDAKGSAIRSGSFSINAPTIALNSSDLQSLALEGTIKAGRVETGTALLESPALQLSRNGNRTGIDLSGRYDKAPLAGKAAITQNGSRIAIDLQSFAATPRGIAVTLAKPAEILIDNGAATIDTLTIKAGSGTISVNGKAGSTLDLAAEIKALPASLANSFVANIDAGGTIFGTVNASGSTSAPKVAYDLRWDNGTVAPLQAAGLPPVTLMASGTFASNRLSVNSTVTGGGGLDVKGGGTLDLNGSKPLDMQFNASLPLSAVQGLATRQGLVAEGNALADIRVGGTLSAPALSGTITSKGVRLIDIKRNIALEGVTIDIALTGDQARINALSGKVSAGGQVSMSGSVDLKGQGLPADLSIRLDHAVYIDGSLVTSTVDGTLALKGPLASGPTLSGSLTLDKTSITIPSKLPSSISQLNIKHRNAPADVKRQIATLAPQDAPASKDSAIALDLQIAAPTAVYVRGRGIDAELNGKVSIKGTAANPTVSGGFTMRRGRISILTKRLDFTTGQITFGGNLVPIVNFIASTTSGSTTLTSTVSGVATDPDISFSSSPALPQDEVLAQLIFGQSLSRLSPLQIAQLADAVSQLAGGRSTSLFNSLRGAVGVDDLDISTDAQGNAQVGAGKYLNDKTYLEFQQSSEGSKAIINLDVGRGFKLKGEAGASGSSGGGVFYEKEY